MSRYTYSVENTCIYACTMENQVSCMHTLYVYGTSGPLLALYSPVVSAVLGLRKLGACKAVSTGRLTLVEGGTVERALIAFIVPVSSFFGRLQILLQTYAKKMNGMIPCNRAASTAAVVFAAILGPTRARNADIGYSIQNGRKVASESNK